MEIRLVLESIILFGILIAFFAFGILVGNGEIEGVFTSAGQINNSTDQFHLKLGESMNGTETKKSNKLINELNPLYTTLVKEIFISKNKSELGLDSEYCKKLFGGSGCLGFNNNGNITFQWTDMKSNKYILCHEILHSYVESKSNKATMGDDGWIYEDPGHAIIDDLAKKEVCYV